MRNQFSSNLHSDWIIKSIATHSSNECLLWPFPTTVDGYGICKFRGKSTLAHRIAFYLTHGRFPQPCARHTCDVPGCINPRHIIEGTQQQNIADMIARGRKAVGAQMPQAKMTDAIVRKIRAEYVPWKNGTAKLVKKYGLNRKNVYNIVMGRAWKHVQ